MSTPQAVATPSRRSAGDYARERLLADIPVTERRLELAGISTPVLEGGSGQPIVLLHGPGEYAAKWRRVIPDLVTTHRVVAPDLPGHGASQISEESLDAERVLAWLGELIERTCPSTPVLVGQIFSGAIAARFAVDRGGQLSRLVLVDTLGLVPFEPAPEFARALTDFMTEPTEDTHDRLWEQCAFDLARLREEMGESWQWRKAYNVDRAQTPTVQAAMHSLMGLFGMPAIPPSDLARIAVPTTLIWGRHDLATTLEVAETASAGYGWPLRVIEGAADDPATEQPEAFLKALRLALGGS